MKRKVIALVCVIALTLSLTSCGMLSKGSSNSSSNSSSYADKQDTYLKTVQSFVVFTDQSYTVQEICEAHFANDNWYVDLNKDPVVVQFEGNSMYDGTPYRSWIVFEVTEDGQVSLDNYRYQEVDSLTAITSSKTETQYLYGEDALNAFYVVCEAVVGWWTIFQFLRNPVNFPI